MSNIHFSISVFGQNVSDDEWIQQRLASMHDRYTAPGDHDQFLFKLQQAQKNATSTIVADALAQIIIRREEQRPLVRRS